MLFGPIIYNLHVLSNHLFQSESAASQDEKHWKSIKKDVKYHQNPDFWTNSD